MTDGVRIEPASAAAFALVEHALTGGGDGGSCWCRFLLETRSAFDASSRDAKRAALREELAAAEVAPALVATIGGDKPMVNGLTIGGADSRNPHGFSLFGDSLSVSAPFGTFAKDVLGAEKMKVLSEALVKRANKLIGKKSIKRVYFSELVVQ